MSLQLCVCVVHSSQSPPFSVAAVCVFVCDLFSCPYGRQETTDDGQTVRILEDHQEGKHLLPTTERGLPRACDFDLWVADCHCKTCRGAATHQSVARPGFPLKAPERPIFGRFGGNLYCGLQVCRPCLKGLHHFCSRGLSYLLAQAQALERSLLRLRPGGSSLLAT